MKLVIAALVLAAAPARADGPEASATATVGAMAGVDDRTFHAGVVGELGLGLGPLALHGQATDGRGTTIFEQKSFTQLRAGLELHHCWRLDPTRRMCPLVGLDLGRQTEGSAGYVPRLTATSFPRIGLELSSGALVVRVLVDVGLGPNDQRGYDGVLAIGGRIVP